jgi:hypothetical protein
MKKDLLSCYEIFSGIAKMIPPKGWLWIVGVVFVIPTSYEGYVWSAFKIVKQQSNCYSDLYESVGTAAPGSPEAHLERIMADLDKYGACNQSVNPRIGTAAFLKEEYERSRAGN